MDKAASPVQDNLPVQAIRASFHWNYEANNQADAGHGHNDGNLTAPIMLLQLKTLHFLPVYESTRNELRDSTTSIHKWTVCIENSRVFVSEASGDEWHFSYISDPLPLKTKSAIIHPPTRCVVLTDRKGDIYTLKFGKSDTDDTGSGIGELKRIASHVSNSECVIVGQFLCKDLLFSSDRDNKIRCLPISRPYDFQYYLLGHKRPVKGMTLIDNERRLLSVSDDGEMRLWDLDTQKCEETFQLSIPEAATITDEDSLAPSETSFSCITVSTSSHGKCERILCAVRLSEAQEQIPIYELSENRKSLRLLRSVSAGTLWWVQEKLFIQIKSFENLVYPLEPAQMDQYLKDAVCVDFGNEVDRESSDTIPSPKRLKISPHGVGKDTPL